MEGSEAAAAAKFDVSEIHKLLDEAEAEFHKLFEGDRAPSTRSHVERVTPLLSNVRTIIDLAAAEAEKE